MGMTSTRFPEKESRVKKFLNSPLRFMVKARDFYVNGMTRFSDKVARYDTVSSLPGSFCGAGGTARSDDYTELVRGNLENRVLAQDLKKNKKKTVKSKSGGLGRIEEDKPCDFSEDSASNYSRSRSCAGFSGKTTAARFHKPAGAAAVY